ncbi:MAG: Rrf2 family transcriptional regulator, partial [Bacteroidota bacterium]|nr:Rrf2 family transcriptional regulator [Bacteroidota bacterium]
SILLELKRHGLVTSQQGSLGGYTLAKSPSEINLADLHRIFEGPIALIACAAERFYNPCKDCLDVDTCKLRMTMKEVRDITFNALESITIQKIIDKK